MGHKTLPILMELVNYTKTLYDPCNELVKAEIPYYCCCDNACGAEGWDRTWEVHRTKERAFTSGYDYHFCSEECYALWKLSKL